MILDDEQTTEEFGEETPDSSASPDSVDETEQEASAAPDDDDSDTHDVDAPVEEPARDFRFQSHEEAEKGYRNLQGEFTRAAQERAELRRKLEAVESERREAKQFEERMEKLRSYVADRHSKYLEDIDRIDPDDPNYRKLVGDITAEYEVDRRAYEQSLLPNAERGTRNAELPEPSSPEVTWDDVKAMATKAGIDPDDPVFIGATQRVSAVDEQGNPRTFEEQVEMAVQETRKYQQGLVAKARQKQQPMGRSGNPKPRTPPEEATRPFTMAEIKARVEAKRRAPRPR